ncbi:MAG: hypothetical protein ABFC63_06660 [Thermoguttaceae bacterium]
MTMMSPLNDLAAVADGMETVRLLRRGNDSVQIAEVIAHALRRAISTGEASIVSRGDVHKSPATNGQCTMATTAWHLPVAELPESPSLGDVILDGQGERWTVMTVKQATLGARWRCETRNVAIAYGLDDTISVLKAATVNGQTTWQTWKTGIRARIQLSNTEIDTEAETPATTRSYRIFVAEDLDLDHNCCVRGPDGTLYTLTGTVGGYRIGELQTIEAEITS